MFIIYLLTGKENGCTLRQPGSKAMKFTERLNRGYRDKEYKNLLPLILSIIAGVLLLGLLLFFLLAKPFSHGSKGSLVLSCAQDEWLVNPQQAAADNRVWLESKNVKIESAVLCDGSGETVAEFSEDADNDMKFFTLVSIPLDQAREFTYYAKCTTDSAEEIETDPVTIHVVDAFPDAYFDSEEQTDEKLNDLIGSEDYQNLTTEEKLDKIVDALNALADQNPDKGEAYVVKNSISYNEAAKSVSFVEAAGTYCYISLEEREEGINAGSQQGRDDANLSYFDAEYKDKVEGSVLILSAIYESEWENNEYYSVLCDAIESETSLTVTHETATLDHLRNDLSGNDFIVIECHGYLDELYGVTVPMIAAFGTVSDEQMTDELKSDLVNHRVCKKYLTQRGIAANYYVLTPLFFSYYYSDNKLQNSIVHLGSCEGFGDDLENQNGYMSYSFIDCGADAVVGHINSVYTIYDRTLVFEELNSLMNSKTIGESLTDAEKKYGSSDKDFMLNFGDMEGKLDAANHLAAYNNVHGNTDAKLFDIASDQPAKEKTPETQPATERPTEAEKSILADYVSDTPYMFDVKNNGTNNNLKLYILEAGEDEITFRINDKKGYLNFTNRIVAPVDETNAATFRFKDSIGREYVAHMEFVAGKIYLNLSNNSSDMSGTFTLASEGWMSKSAE